MEHLQHLLQQISKVVDEERIQQEEKRKRGEKFNIFNVLDLSRNEVRLHSAFLAELLNPNGNHGLGAKLLKAFVDDVLPKDGDFLFDVDSAKPLVEYYIGDINESYTEGGRIDILIQDKNRHSIIIENKIDAGDQKYQLLRYYNFITKREGLTEDEFILLYLTPEGTEPSEDSLGKSNVVKYKCISYREDILNWLERSIEIAALHPAIREIIQQYHLNLQQILNIMSEDNTEKMLKLLLSESNIETTINILSQNRVIRKTILGQFIKNVLSKIALKHGMEFSYDQDFCELIKGRYRTINYTLPACPKASFTIQQAATSVYYGIGANTNLKMEKMEGWSDAPQEWYPYGINYFDIRIWDSEEALFDMQKGEKSEIYKRIDEEITRIINGGYLQKLNDLL